MVEKKEITLALKTQIFEKEKNKSYSSEQFTKIENKVKESLKMQKTDQALEDITTGGFFLGVSDIHYEVFEDFVNVRFRIDGVLVDIFKISFKEYKLLLERLKYASNLKLNITDVPQDGKYSLNLNGNHKIDVRISTLPTKYGENVVSRILDSQKTIVNFEDLGFFWMGKRMVENAIKNKNGMIIITGPTGSGKTTTLYTILSTLNTRDKKIMTLEDPIEYEIPGIIQSEVNERNNFTFDIGLKALMRQDPNIIMVGEVRDYETLNTATSASLTGHLVLTTLHTKSATETLDRIINMGLKPFIVASAVDIIIAQRLVRKICPNCKVEKEKTVQEIAVIKAMMEEIGMKLLPIKSIKLYSGTGCNECNNSGYKGRIGIFEILNLSSEIKDLVREGASSEEIQKIAKNGSLITMREDGILKAIKGYTTIEEILRVL